MGEYSAISAEERTSRQNEYLKKKLNSESWRYTSIDERVKLLQQVEHNEAQKSPRPSCDLKTAKMKDYEMGEYDPTTNTIVVNEQLVHSDNPRRALETTLHEGRHAYQQDVMNNPDKYPDHPMREIWAENNYISPNEDFEAYYNQPIEVDARSYANAHVNEYTDTQEQQQSIGRHKGIGR